MSEPLQRIADAPWFQNGILVVIVFAGILVGLETYPAIVARHGPLLGVLDALVLSIFSVEILIKMGAEGRRPWRYFRDPWNVFDFAIVAVCFLPFGGSGAAVLRLARLLRVLRLVKALPKLQILVSALLKSIPSMGYVSLLLLLLFYLYAVSGTMLFGVNDPMHFGTLELSMLSLFRAVTLEDWTDLMYTQMYGCAVYGYENLPHLCTESVTRPLLAPLYFVSFVLVGTMIFLNLFVGVILSGMEEARREVAGEPEEADLLAEIRRLQVRVEALHDRLDPKDRRDVA